MPHAERQVHVFSEPSLSTASTERNSQRCAEYPEREERVTPTLTHVLAPNTVAYGGPGLPDLVLGELFRRELSGLHVALVEFRILLPLL